MMMLLASSVFVVSVPLLHVEFLGLVSGKHLVNFVLDVLGGGEGGISSVLLLHAKLLSPVPVDDTLANFVGDLVLENGDTGVDGQRVLSVLLCLDGLLNLVLLGNLLVLFLIMLAQVLIISAYSVFCFVLSALSTLSTLSSTQACCLLASDLTSECITK
jgi:hypothetical protein